MRVSKLYTLFLSTSLSAGLLVSPSGHAQTDNIVPAPKGAVRIVVQNSITGTAIPYGSTGATSAGSSAADSMGTNCSNASAEDDEDRASR
jgi:hypothetical protein